MGEIVFSLKQHDFNVPDKLLLMVRRKDAQFKETTGEGRGKITTFAKWVPKLPINRRVTEHSDMTRRRYHHYCNFGIPYAVVCC